MRSNSETEEVRAKHDSSHPYHDDMVEKAIEVDLGDTSNSLHRKVDYWGSYRKVLEKSLLNYLLREKVLEKSLLDYLSREKVLKKLKVNCFSLKKSLKTLMLNYFPEE